MYLTRLALGFHSSDYTVCIEVVVLVFSSFLMSRQDNTCKRLTKSLQRKGNEHNYWIATSWIFVRKFYHNVKLHVLELRTKSWLSVLVPTCCQGKRVSFMIRECSFKSVRKNHLPVLVKKQNATATRRMSIFFVLTTRQCKICDLFYVK